MTEQPNEPQNEIILFGAAIVTDTGEELSPRKACSFTAVGGDLRPLVPLSFKVQRGAMDVSVRFFEKETGQSFVNDIKIPGCLCSGDLARINPK